MKRLGLILLMLLTGCTQAQPELRETKEVQTSIPYSDEELIESANDQIEDEAYYVDSITPKILNFEEMVSLYIKILKKTITDTELELFKYNLDISCCVPNAIYSR